MLPSHIIISEQFLSMSSSQTERLNFYSKYNRVREKQDIDSLYALIDTDIDRVDNLILTLNCSRTLEPPDDSSPIRYYQPDKQMRKQQVSIIPSLQEQEEKERLREMEQKLRKLERLERDFHDQLDRSEREHRRKQQLKEVKKKEREHYRHQLINVIQHTSQHSQHSRHSQHPHPPRHEHEDIQQQPPQRIDDDFDDYYSGGEIKLRDENDFDVKQTRRKLKEIIEIQRKREKQVESVEENNDVNTASIVIGRLNIMHKPKETVIQNSLGFGEKSKEVKNYCEVQLSHSQSANVLRNVQSVDKIQLKQHIPEAQEQEEPHMNYHYQNQHLYEQADLNYNHNHDEHDSQQYEVQENDQEEQVDESNSIHKESDCNYEYQYEHSQGIEPPITLTQEDGNNQLTGEDGSQLNEEIADHVVSIGDLSEQQSQPPAHVAHRGPLFLSQAHPRQTFHHEHEVQSIAQSIDFHPLEPQNAPQIKSQIIYSGHDVGVEPGDRKTSFKRLMAENRANLIPRLAISTILNQHINQALGDYRVVHPPPPLPPPSPIPAAATLHESIISSEGSIAKPAGKVNFKSLLRSKLNSSRVEKKPVSRDPVKVQANKNLLLSFFDQN